MVWAMVCQQTLRIKTCRDQCIWGYGGVSIASDLDRKTDNAYADEGHGETTEVANPTTPIEWTTVGYIQWQLHLLRQQILHRAPSSFLAHSIDLGYVLCMGQGEWLNKFSNFVGARRLARCNPPALFRKSKVVNIVCNVDLPSCKMT